MYGDYSRRCEYGQRVNQESYAQILTNRQNLAYFSDNRSDEKLIIILTFFDVGLCILNLVGTGRVQTVCGQSYQIVLWGSTPPRSTAEK